VSIIALGWLSAGLRLALWAITCFALVTMLDRFNNDSFSQDKATIARSPLACALYRGLRWVGILVGSAHILG
jgi:hypothetical protein